MSAFIKGIKMKYIRSIIYDKEHETFENDGVFVENWGGKFKIRFKDTTEGAKAREMWKKLNLPLKREKNE